MFSLAYTHAVVLMIRQEHFLDPTAHHLPHHFLLSCKTPWKSCPQSLSHSSPPVPLKPTPVASPPLYPRNYTCQGQKWLLWSDPKVSWSLLPCPSAGFDIIDSSFLHTSLGIQNTKLSWFSSYLTSCSLSFYLIRPLLPVFFSCWSALRFSCWPSSLLLLPSLLEISSSLMAWKISSERLITPKFLSPTQTLFLNSKPLFPIIYSVSSVIYCTCLKLSVYSSPKMAASPTNF